MTDQTVSRRDVLTGATAAAAFAWGAHISPLFAFPTQENDEELVPFLNMPRSRPGMLDWETLTEWLTDQDQVFNVSHYGVPKVEASKYALEITGQVEKPASYTLDDLKGMAKASQLMTLECSGNGAGKGFIGAIYNSKWVGTLLAPLLKAAGPRPGAKEVVFIGHDTNKETLRKGTRNELEIVVPFGRSMAMEDATRPDLLLAYERNGEPLTQPNGFPVRLIVPGWYGIANVKWLRRIEVRDTRYMGKYMGREYVTVRGERRDGEVVFVETSVTKMRLKSMVARVTQRAAVDGRIPTKAYGAAWNDGTPVTKVEVKVDDGPWQAAKLDAEPRAKHSWLFFSIDLGKLAPGKHTIVSRAIDATGRIQPSVDDDEIALKKTYWEANQQWVREIELEA